MENKKHHGGRHRHMESRGTHAIVFYYHKDPPRSSCRVRPCSVKDLKSSITANSQPREGVLDELKYRDVYYPVLVQEIHEDSDLNGLIINLHRENGNRRENRGWRQLTTLGLIRDKKSNEDRNQILVHAFTPTEAEDMTEQVKITEERHGLSGSSHLIQPQREENLPNSASASSLEAQFKQEPLDSHNSNGISFERIYAMSMEELRNLIVNVSDGFPDPLRLRIDTIIACFDGWRSELDSLKRCNLRLNEECSVFFAGLKARSADEMAELQRKVADLERALAERVAEVDQLRSGGNGGLEQKIAELQQRMVEEDVKKKEMLEKQRQIIAKKEKESQRTVAEANKQVADLRKNLTNLGQKQTEWTAERQTLQASLEKAQSALRKAEETLAPIKAEISELQRKYAELEKNPAAPPPPAKKIVPNSSDPSNKVSKPANQVTPLKPDQLVSKPQQVTVTQHPKPATSAVAQKTVVEPQQAVKITTTPSNAKSTTEKAKVSATSAKVTPSITPISPEPGAKGIPPPVPAKPTAAGSTAPVVPKVVAVVAASPTSTPSPLRTGFLRPQSNSSRSAIRTDSLSPLPTITSSPAGVRPSPYPVTASNSVSSTRPAVISNVPVLSGRGTVDPSSTGREFFGSGAAPDFRASSSNGPHERSAGKPPSRGSRGRGGPPHSNPGRGRGNSHSSPGRGPSGREGPPRDGGQRGSSDRDRKRLHHPDKSRSPPRGSLHGGRPYHQTTESASKHPRYDRPRSTSPNRPSPYQPDPYRPSHQMPDGYRRDHGEQRETQPCVQEAHRPSYQMPEDYRLDQSDHREPLLHGQDTYRAGLSISESYRSEHPDNRASVTHGQHTYRESLTTSQSYRLEQPDHRDPYRAQYQKADSYKPETRETYRSEYQGQEVYRQDIQGQASYQSRQPARYQPEPAVSSVRYVEATLSELGHQESAYWRRETAPAVAPGYLEYSEERAYHDDHHSNRSFSAGRDRAYSERERDGQYSSSSGVYSPPPPPNYGFQDNQRY